MADLTPDAIEARNAIASALGNGKSDAVLLSSDPEGPGLWSSALKKAVFGAVAVSVALGAIGGPSIGQAVMDKFSGPQDEISFQMDEPSIQAFADQVGPKIFSRGDMKIEIGETFTETNSRFFTVLDPSDRVQSVNECYAVYQPALWNDMGSHARLENTMETFALAHCMMAGENFSAVSNIAGEANLDHMMTNLAAARLLEGNVLGQDGREVTDISSVRDAWFASQFSQQGGVGVRNIDGITAWLVLRRAEDTLSMHEKPGTIAEFKDQVSVILEGGYKDFGTLLPSMQAKFPGDRIGEINDALRDVYNSSSPETRLDKMDAFMRDPAKATEQIQSVGLDAYLGLSPKTVSIGQVKVSDPFNAPEVSIEKVNVTSPFEMTPEADFSFENGPKF